VNAVLVSKDFGLTLVSPDDLNAYAPLYLTVCEDSIHTPLPLIFAFFFIPHLTCVYLPFFSSLSLFLRFLNAQGLLQRLHVPFSCRAVVLIAVIKKLFADVMVKHRSSTQKETLPEYVIVVSNAVRVV
jgi:hypothetical protein